MQASFAKAISELDKKIIDDPRITPALLRDIEDTERKLGLLHDQRTICSFLRPHFMPRAKYEKVVNAASILSRVFEKLAAAALENETILAKLGMTDAQTRMARIDPGYKTLCVTSRMDAFFDGDDFKFLEYNAESPASIGDQMQLEKVLETIPPVKEFVYGRKIFKPRPHQALLESLLLAYREFGGKKQNPNIAIVDWDGVSTATEFVILKDYFESQGFTSIIADPHELEYNGEYLHRQGWPVDIFYKRVIIHEFLEKFGESHPILDAYRDGNLCMANSFRSKLAHKKAVFGVLSDEKFSYLFSDAEREIIRRHIPWTRRVEETKTSYFEKEIDLLDHICHNRENFILKPNDEYGGKGITLGWEKSQDEWDKALSHALAADYVVQEKVAVGKVKIPAFSDTAEMQELLIDFNPFIFGNRVEGAMIRLSSSSLVNVSQGGGETALYVIEEEF